MATNLARFSGVLWRERDLLGRLVTRLPDDPAHCDDLLRHMRVLELHRAAAGQAVAAELGTDGAWTLPELAAAAPGAWKGVLAGHHRALRALAVFVLAVAGEREKPTIQRSLRDFLAV